MTSFRKLLKEVIKDNQEIKSRLSPLNAEKAKKYDEVKEHLNNIELHVESAKAVMDESGTYVVVVKYAPIVKILQEKPNSKGVVGDNMFKSINALDLISIKDMQKIQEAVTKANSLNEPLK